MTVAKTATILFVDQVGSTRLLAALGDEAMVAIRSDLWSLFVSVVGEHHGRVLSDEGDGGSALFDRACDAVEAGLAMLSATRERDDLVLRAGCNTGAVLPTATGMVGLAIHLAARVCDAAPARYLAATDATLAELRLGTEPLRPTSLGRRNMKGLPEPIALSLVTLESDPLPTPEALDQARSSPLLEETVDATSFVGRASEVVLLHRSLFPPRSDRSSVVLLAGDPGSGKTALSYHVARELSDDGVLCLIGRSDEALDDPFFELIEMLRHVIRSIPLEDLNDHLSRHGTLATRLFPEITDRLGLDRALATEVAPDRQQLFEAIGDLIALLARRQPVVLLLEDLHWASTQTLDLFRSLLRSEVLFGVSVLMTLRQHDLDRSAEARDFLHWLTVEVHPVRVDLEPLTRDEVERLCTSLLDIEAADVVADLARHLTSQTAGNALFCTEMLRSLRGNTALLSSDAADIGSLVVVPATVQELALTRVRKLGVPVADVLADAAVLGESFDLVELRAMSNGDVFDALDAAERAGVVRPDDAGGTHFTFGHALVHQALYQQLTTTSRLRKHRAAADSINPMTDPARTWAFDRLHHLRNAGPLADALEIAEAAGAAARAAADKLALADTVQFRQLAVEQLRLAGAEHREQAVALLELGRAQTANALQVGRSTMVEAFEAARRDEDWDLVAEVAIAYGGDLKENQAAPDVSEPVALISQALEHHRDPSALRARLLSALAVWQRQHRPFVERLASADEALEIARRLGDRRTLAMILSERHRSLHGPNAVMEAMSASDELELLADELASDALMFQAMYLRVIAAMELGDWDLATNHADRLLALGNSLQNVEGRRVGAMWLNLNAQMRGNWEEANRQLAELMKIVADYSEAELTNLVAATSFVGLWFEHGATLLFQLSGESSGRASTRAWFAAEAGEEALARRRLEEAPSAAELEASLDYMWWHDVVSLTRAASALGDRALAAELYRIILPYRTANAMMGFACFLGAAEHHLGTLAATLGDNERALEHFGLAADRHGSMGAVPFAELTAKESANLR